MAVTAREVIMVFRGQNYLSGAIRRVGSDMASLSRTQQLTTQRSQLQINAQRIRSARSLAQAELASVQSGGRRLVLQKAIAAQQITQLSLVQERARLEDSINARQTSTLRAQAQASRLSRLVQAGRPARGFNMAETVALSKAATQSVEDLNFAQATAMDQREVIASRMAQQSIAIQKLSADEAQLATREAQLTQIINTRTEALTLAQAKLDQNALAMKLLPIDRIKGYAQNIEHLGRVVQMFGLIAAASFGYAADQAAKFQTSAVLAATQAITPSRNSVAQIQRTGGLIAQQTLGILSSGRAVASSDELNKGAYDILSGVTSLKGDSLNKAKQAIALLKEFNQVTKANFGLVDFNQVTQAGITILNTFGTSFKNLPHEFDVMQNAVNRGRLTLGQFVQGLNQTAQPAKAAGFTFDQMAATVSFLSTKFPNANRAFVGYARLVEILSNPKLIAGLKGVGVSITDVTGKHLIPFDQIIAKLVKKFPELEKGGLAVTNFFKKFSGQTGFIGARRAFTAAIQDPTGLAKFAQDIPANANGLVNASAQALSQTGAVKWKELTTQFKALVIVLGQGAIPAFQAIAKPIEYLIKKFNELSPRTKQLIGYIGAFVAIGALLGGTLLAIVGGLVSVGASMYGAIQIWKFGRAALIGLSAEAGEITAGAALGLGIPVAIFLLIKYHTQVMAVVHALGGMKVVLGLIAGFVAALRFAPMLFAMAGIATEANTAAGEVGGLRLALLSLGGPEVLAALAAVAAALIIIYALRNKTQHVRPKGFVTSSDGQALVKRNGQYFTSTRTDVRDRVPNLITPISVADASDKFKVNLTAPSAIAQAIKDSPRYQHAMRANQEAVDKFSNSLAKQAVIAKIDRVNGITGVTAQRDVQQWITLVEKAHAAMLGSPNDLEKAKKYEAIQIALNTRFKNQPVLLAAINDILSNYDNNLKSVTDSTKQLGVTTQDVLSGLQSMYNDFRQTEAGLFGTLFQGPLMTSPAQQDRLQFGGRASGKDLLNDLKSQVRQFDTFHRLLDSLRSKGASNELIKQLTAGGATVESIRNIKALNSLDPKTLGQYFSEFNRGQKVINDATMRDLNNQLKIYRQHGRNIALAIIAGLRDENVAVTNTLTKMIKGMFPGLPTGATGAGGKPTHHRIPVPGVTPVKVTVTTGKTSISDKNKQRHKDLADRNRYSGRGPGPR
jgi:TP901 family phage tail tape measure protein